MLYYFIEGERLMSVPTLYRDQFMTQDSSEPQEGKYLAIIPGFGPNNQYLGLKDAMYISKILGRTLALPAFFLHSFSDEKDLRPFDRTFNASFIEEYLPAVELTKFRSVCNGLVDALVWTREDDSWYHAVQIWMRYVDMKFNLELTTRKDLLFYTVEEILDYFKPTSDLKCIALAFPFRTVAETEERQSLARFLVHSKEVADIAKNVVKEMDADARNLLSIHWRWGEDSCGWYYSPEPHNDYDFCWGTSVFHYAKLEDILSVLINLAKRKNMNRVYLSVSKSYLDVPTLETIQRAMKKVGILLFRSVDLPSLRDLEEYYLSLVEQEVCSSSKVFVASTDSTWSDFVRDYHRETNIFKTLQNESFVPFTEIETFETLLEREGKPFDTWNRVNHEDVLQQRRKW
eukprot:TRINITY_DN4137_c0_g1_i14.p1 TRINITY_DN4137_c0_g1~~TRINITY_DN4137_c0_g1_i14.p1  ORF type:complete len:402 (-),score=75.43 TRINITY_DN4137_c0_g1_i14:213-1418(-)